jgi:hypothetical protein
MASLDELAAGWWRFHGRASGSPQELSEAEYQLMDAIDDEVDERSRRIDSLTALVAALVRYAPDEESVPYLGTWVLEDAETYVGPVGIERVLASLDPATARRVESGYLPNYGLPPEGNVGPPRGSGGQLE